MEAANNRAYQEDVLLANPFVYTNGPRHTHVNETDTTQLCHHRLPGWCCIQANKNAKRRHMPPNHLMF